MISVKDFGKLPDGRDTQLFILDNGKMSVYISDYGATIVAVNVPDKNGILTDIVLGFDNVEPYSGEVDYLGATVGRFANRIEGGKFSLNGIDYNLAVNNGPNHLHGGKEGFNHKLFDAYVDDETLTLSYTSPDMEEGYPGELEFSVSFTLGTRNDLVIEYSVSSTKDTVVNFTNHSYFNLNGALSERPIYNHKLSVIADAYCDADENGLVNGAVLPVRNTVMDLRCERLLGDVLNKGYEPLERVGGGFDHNFVTSFERGNFKKVAVLRSIDTGIAVDCYSDQPGIQIYTANFMNCNNGKCNSCYSKHSAVCLETQGFPNSTSFSYFPSPLLKAGDLFSSKTVYRFRVEEAL